MIKEELTSEERGRAEGGQNGRETGKEDGIRKERKEVKERGGRRKEGGKEWE